MPGFKCSSDTLLFGFGRKLGFGQPCDYADYVLSLWILLSGFYYMPSSLGSVYVKLVPSCLLRNVHGQKHSRKFYNYLNEFMLDPATMPHAMELFRVHLRSCAPNAHYCSYSDEVRSERLKFRKTCFRLYKKVNAAAYKSSPALNVDCVPFVTKRKAAQQELVVNDSNNRQVHGVYTQALPEGIRPREPYEGSSSCFHARRDEEKLRDALAFPYVPFWNLRLADAAAVFEQLQWTLLFFDKDCNYKTAVELSDYVFVPSCDAYGPTVTFLFNSAKREPSSGSSSCGSTSASPGAERARAAPSPLRKFSLQLPCNTFCVARWLMLFELCNARYRDFGEVFVKSGAVSNGSFSRVYEIVNVLTGERLAAKAVEKCSLSRANGFNEIKILRAISHPSVGRFYEAFCNNQTIMILTEYYYGGGLNSYINRFSRLREDSARTALYKLLQALLVIQRYHVLHRDLKNDNIMLKTADDPTSVVIIDFGLSSHLYSKQITMRCGSPGFVAPEVLADRPLTDMKSDVFSLGVIFFTMLTGKEPFSAKNNEMTLRRNAKCEVQFTEPVFDTLSEKCKSLLAWLLQRDPEKRCDVANALQHPFFTNEPLKPGLPVLSNAAQSLARLPQQCFGVQPARAALPSARGAAKAERGASVFATPRPGCAQRDSYAHFAPPRNWETPANSALHTAADACSAGADGLGGDAGHCEYLLINKFLDR